MAPLNAAIPTNPSTTTVLQTTNPAATAVVVDVPSFYESTNLWTFLTESLHWHYTGVYWPSGSQGNQYGVDFFYNVEEVVEYAKRHNFHLLYANEYRHWHEKSSGTQKHLSFGRDEIVLPSRKRARRSCGMPAERGQPIRGQHSQQQLEFLNFQFHDQYFETTTMECN